MALDLVSLMIAARSLGMVLTSRIQAGGCMISFFIAMFFK
jgi:hypothetical protein